MMKYRGIRYACRNRFISVFLIILMVCACIPGSVAAVTPPLTVSAGTATATAGGANVAVNVNLSNVAANLPRGINNSGFTINYNNNVLEIVSVTRGSLVPNAADMNINPGTVAEISANNGRIVLLHNDDSGGQRQITADGTYAVLTFKAKSGAASGSYPLTFQAGANSIGQMNVAGTYPEDVNMASVVLNAGAITIPVVDPVPTPLTVSAGTATATAGGANVAVNVNLSNVAANLPRGINNSGFTINYNNNVLEIVSVARGSLVPNAADMNINPGTVAEISANNGRIVLLHNDDSGGQRQITSDGTYAVLTFKAKSGAESGSYPLTFQAGANSIGQMNVAGTYPEDVNMASVVLNAGAITIENAIDECFIATASFGTKFEPSVVILRQFRDQFLLTNFPGRAFVKLYYEHSPSVAYFIANNEILKALVRTILTPVVGIVYILLHPGLFYALVAVLMVAIIWQVRKRKAKFVSH